MILSGPQLNALASSSQFNIGREPVLILRQAGEVLPDTAQWLIDLAPSSMVLSSDSADPGSLPPPAFEAAFGAQRLLRTDHLGTIEFTTDGMRLWAVSQRQTRDLPAP